MFYFLGSKNSKTEPTTLLEQQTTFTIITIQDETADWQTYKNEEYGFEMKYPNNWHVELSNYQIEFRNMSIEEIKNFSDGLPPIERIELQIKTWYSSLAEWEDEFEEQMVLMKEAGFGDALIEKEEITVGGLSGYKIVVSFSQDESSKAYVGIFKEGKLYEFNQLEPIECYSGNCGTFSQILSTFRFLE